MQMISPLTASHYCAADDKTIRMWEYGIQAQAKYIAGGRWLAWGVVWGRCAAARA